MTTPSEAAYCMAPLAAYAARPEISRGRGYTEPESATRNAFARDRDRIIHASAFRRLRYKTQVFVHHEGDHFRTRLTHTLEVAQIARTLARALNAHEDLTETIALAHDLGHPPFAHAGEWALQDAMAAHGGFDHNDQTLRIVTLRERKYPGWPGLNLTWESLEGIVKHNGPMAAPYSPGLEALQQEMDIEPQTHSGIEGQIAALSDDIAYNNHDVQDGLQARLFTLDSLREVPLIGGILEHVAGRYPDLDQELFINEVIREMIGEMVGDVLAETRRRLSAYAPQSPQNIREAGQCTVAFSDEMKAKVDGLRHFLKSRMYRHYQIIRMNRRVERIVHDLFAAFVKEPAMLPESWQAELPEDVSGQARVICDYIAGMTDRYAMLEHKRIFDLYQEIM